MASPNRAVNTPIFSSFLTLQSRSPSPRPDSLVPGDPEPSNRENICPHTEPRNLRPSHDHKISEQYGEHHRVENKPGDDICPDFKELFQSLDFHFFRKNVISHLIF